MTILCKKKLYIIGSLLSCFFTLVSFVAIIQKKYIDKNFIFVIIISSAILQSIVQLICFLHIYNTKKINWKLISLLFTILITFILVFGSYWIMSHLHENFM